MGRLETAFLMSDMPAKLARRADSFRAMLAHLDEHPHGGVILETGTARIQGNWAGDGQSTLIWNWVLEQDDDWEAHSIDLNPNAVDIARAQCPKVQFHVSDSVKALERFNSCFLKSVRLLYLDSFDWDESLNFESSFHHLAELATIWALLPSGCMVVVDDRHEPMRGKHWMVEGFMKKHGIAPVFVGYQIGWVKP